MPAIKEKKFCNIGGVIKDNKELVNVVDDLCADNLIKSYKSSFTFLKPNKQLVTILKNKVADGELEEANDLFKSLFIEGYHKEMKKGEQYITFNRKIVKDDLSVSTKPSIYIQWKNLERIFVLEYSGKTFPSEGDEAPRKPRSRSRKKVLGSNEDVSKTGFTRMLINKYKESKEINAVFGVAVNVLLKYLSENCDKAKFEELKKKIDPNMIITWYILVQPGSSPQDPYVNELMFADFTKYYSSDFNKNLDFIKEILDNHKLDPEEIKKIKQAKDDLRKFYEENKSIDKVDSIVSKIKSTYTDKLKLLEDELRFAYSDEVEFDDDDIFDQHLNNIQWYSPEDSLAIIATKNRLKRFTIYESSMLVILSKFINSNSFHYTLFDSKSVEKVDKAIKSGAGIIFGGIKFYEDIKAYTGSSPNLPAFVKMLSAEQKTELKKLL